MDLSVFEGMMFNPIECINRAFASAKNKDEEQFVTDSVLRLQLFMKQLNNSLDETSTQIDSAIPHVMEDSNTMQGDLDNLQEQLLNLEKHVLGVEENTGAYTKSLRRIDKMKTKMEMATAALGQLEQWTDLADSLEEVLKEGSLSNKDKLKEVAAKTQSISKSLDAMSALPYYHDKKLQLERLYNRLETSINDPFEEALKKMDKDKSSSYMELYSSMNRTGSASRSWRRVAARHTAKHWAGESEHTVRALTRILIEEALLQAEWLLKVLKPKAPHEELMRLHTDLLLSLDPSLTKVMKAKFKKCETPQSKIKMLTNMKLDIDDWILAFYSVLKSTGHKPAEINHTLVQEFGRASYAPLRELLPNYADAQAQVFLEYLKEFSMDEEEEEAEDDEEKEDEDEDEDQGEDEDEDEDEKKKYLKKRSEAILLIAENCGDWLENAYGNGTSIAGAAIIPFYATAVESLASVLVDLVNTHSRKIETSFLEAVKSGEETGVFSDAFPACLVLEKAIVILLDTFSERPEEEGLEKKQIHELLDLRTLLLNEKQRKKSWVLPPSVAGLRRAKDTIKALARTILRNPIDVELDKIPQLSVWHNNDALTTDLPDFALAPQEYITEIGQYLMTLLQHLEMHMSEGEEPLQFLNELCVHTCDMYAEKILNIRNMDALGTKRCLTDIAYLSSVVEDLGSKITPSLKNLEKSLRAATPASPNEK